jgi:hypothetical protein
MGNLSSHAVKIIVIRVSIKKREAKEQELRNDVLLSLWERVGVRASARSRV